jgi:hypothetical protein
VPLQTLLSTKGKAAQHLPHRHTLGHHRRYPKAAIRELLASLTEEVRAA